jgi:2,3-bisphosphoglycerate-dependent phosphoglycerate mutase
MASDDAPPTTPAAPPPGAPAVPPAGPHAVITTFLIVRHAESEANAGAYFASQSDSPLSELGRQQVEALTVAMDRVHVHAIYSSDLSRARDTVAAMAASRGLEVTTTERLRERAMGVLTGMTFDDARARFPELWQKMILRDPFAAPEGGESHQQLAARVAGVLDELHARHRGQTVLVGSHGVAIHHMIRYLVGIHDVTLPVWTSVDNASVTRVDIYEREPGHRAPRLVYVNRIAPVAGHGHGL